MRRIISCSRRTDIPAFYSKWFQTRLRAGYCHVINPFGGQVYRISLIPEDCDGIVFWTRNPAPLLSFLDEMDARGYRYYFHYTITGYPKAIESHNPPVEQAIKVFRHLSDRVSSDRVRWRYDPILISSVTPATYHFRQFEQIANALQGYTTHCTFSFVDFYGKTQRNLDRVQTASGVIFEHPSLSIQQDIVGKLVIIAHEYGIMMHSCCNDGLAVKGAFKNRCIDPDLITNLSPQREIRVKAEPTRQDCGCILSVDIGAYDTCMFGCTYCYATNSRSAALRRNRAHDPTDSTLWRPSTMHGVDLDSISRELLK